MDLKELKVRIPECYVSYIVNNDASIFEYNNDEEKAKEEKEKVDKWFESLPGFGHFDFDSSESSFYHSNDIFNNMGAMCIEGTYYYEEKELREELDRTIGIFLEIEPRPCGCWYDGNELTNYCEKCGEEITHNNYPNFAIEENFNALKELLEKDFKTLDELREKARETKFSY